MKIASTFQSRPRLGEFFAGIGLMRLGLESQGWQTVVANDIDPAKWAMYRDQFGTGGEFILGDIHDIDAAQLPAMDLATASFPCNDLSLAGGRKGLAGSQSGAFWGFVEVLRNLRERRPPLVLLENVVGFLTSHDGQDLEEALKALNSLGYSVDVFIIDALHFVPQSRQRLFVVGKKADPVLALRETPRFFQSAHRPPALADFIMWHGDINWDLRDLPPFPPRLKSLQDVLENLSPNSSAWWSADRAKYLLDQMSSRHREIAEAMIQSPRVSCGTVFRRVRNGKSMAELRVDGIAGCLRTPRGGSGRQILFQAGSGKFAVRLLTSRECARLMGADDYRIRVPLNQALFGFGDAVCVPVIKWIAENYLDRVLMNDYAERKHAAVSSNPSKTGGYS